MLCSAEYDQMTSVTVLRQCRSTTDRTVRTIVLRGNGGVFCAGGDIKGFKSGMQPIECRTGGQG